MTFKTNGKKETGEHMETGDKEEMLNLVDFLDVNILNVRWGLFVIRKETIDKLRKLINEQG